MRRIKIKTFLKVFSLFNVVIIVIILFLSNNNISNILKSKFKLDENTKETLELIEKPPVEEKMRKFQLEKRITIIEKDVKQNTLEEVVAPVEINQVTFKQNHANLQHKLVHLDLKGAAPKLDYLKSILPIIQSVGGTGLLIEYEDMFPFEDELESIRAGNAYAKQELQDFLKETLKFDLKVIPLIQTFGHMEYVLKMQQFRNLREEDAHPDTICPSKNASIEIIIKMVNQVVKLHTEISQLEWIHIGCDEVYHINKCSDCAKRNENPRRIFVDHVKTVSTYIKETYPFLKVLIWDDMLRGFHPTELENSGLGVLVQPVVWVYASSITALVPNRVWYIYTKTFSGIWVASAFKGASGSTRMLPPLKKHYENNLSWLDFVIDYRIAGTSIKYNFHGLVLTGWSRYHHFSVLCETLPVAMPSLILNLLLANVFMNDRLYTDRKITVEKQYELEKNVLHHWLQALKCYSKRQFTLNSMQDVAEYLDEIEKNIYICDFKERHLYEDIIKLINLENNVLDFHISNAFKHNGFLYYNVNHGSVINFFNFNTLEKAKKLKHELSLSVVSVSKHLGDFFDEYAIKEFLELKVNPLIDIVDRILNAAKVANETFVWKTRPHI